MQLMGCSLQDTAMRKRVRHLRWRVWQETLVDALRSMGAGTAFAPTEAEQACTCRTYLCLRPVSWLIPCNVLVCLVQRVSVEDWRPIFDVLQPELLQRLRVIILFGAVLHSKDMTCSRCHVLGQPVPEPSVAWLLWSWHRIADAPVPRRLTLTIPQPRQRCCTHQHHERPFKHC